MGSKYSTGEGITSAEHGTGKYLIEIDPERFSPTRIIELGLETRFKPLDGFNRLVIFEDLEGASIDDLKTEDWVVNAGEICVRPGSKFP